MPNRTNRIPLVGHRHQEGHPMQPRAVEGSAARLLRNATRENLPRKCHVRNLNGRQDQGFGAGKFSLPASMDFVHPLPVYLSGCRHVRSLPVICMAGTMSALCLSTRLRSICTIRPQPLPFPTMCLPVCLPLPLCLSVCPRPLTAASPPPAPATSPAAPAPRWSAGCRPARCS
jgi:hypothetical protein